MTLVSRSDVKPAEKGAEMSILRPVLRRKKKRKLGKVDIMGREEYADQDLDTKVELIRSLVPIGLMHVYELLDQEVTALAGERYARKEVSICGRRHGSNPGTVGLAGQRIPVRVPRVRSMRGGEIPLRCYDALHSDREVNDLLLKRVLYGISCRNYEGAAESIPGAIGLSGSTVSRGFIEASSGKLRELQERDLSGEDVVALFLDGKAFAEATMVVALGITMSGEKRFLGFVETDTENEKVLTPFLRSLLERGLDICQGLLVILDGGKGLRAAVKKAFRGRALVQRCQWHKRENVVSYLSRSEQASWRKRLGRAYNRPQYEECLAAFRELQSELEDRNQSAAASLAEGFEETLTLHRLGMYGVLGRSLKTTNCLESVNALVEERCAKVDHWKNSSQRHRWLATALVDIEPRLRKVVGYRHLPKLREALMRELKIEDKTSKRKVA
jgi:putative transposase